MREKQQQARKKYVPQEVIDDIAKNALAVEIAGMIPDITDLDDTDLKAFAVIVSAVNSKAADNIINALNAIA